MPARVPIRVPTRGAPAGMIVLIVGVHCRPVETMTTASTPRPVPRMPPRVPRTADSVRNWVAICRRAAPRARRSPISPVRSITETSVVFAMPTAPMRSVTAARGKVQGVGVLLDVATKRFRFGRNKDGVAVCLFGS